jgi:hypothetical protein
MSNDHINRFASLDEMIAFCISLAPEATDIERVFMADWIRLALDEIGASKNHVRTEEIPVKDLSIRKPEDFYLAKSMALYDSGGTEVWYIYEGYGARTHQDTRYVPKFVALYETSHYYNLGNEATTVTDARLTYYAHPTDANGDLIIEKKDRFAIMTFIKYMVALRNDDPTYKSKEQIWEKQAAKARSRKALPDELEFTEGIARKYMSLWTKPSRPRE